MGLALGLSLGLGMALGLGLDLGLGLGLGWIWGPDLDLRFGPTGPESRPGPLSGSGY